MGIQRDIKILIAIGICALAFNLTAQELKTVDVLSTKEGSVWKGTVTEITNDGYYLMETVSGLNLRLHESEVKNVRQHWVGLRKYDKPYSFKEEGFYQTIELSLLANDNAGGLSATYSAGHRFSRWIGIGGGTGITGFDMGRGKNVIPLFVEARGFFLSEKVSPYYALRVGYGFALKNDVNNIDEAKGGYLFNPQLGVRFGGGSAVSYYMGIGLHLQEATYSSMWPFSEGVSVDKYLFKRYEFKFGITF